MQIIVQQLILLLIVFIMLFLFGNRTEKIMRRALQFLFCSITRTGLNKGIKFNENGFPMYNYSSRKGIFIGYQYNPIVFCWLADKLYSGKNTNEDNKSKIFEYAEKVVRKHVVGNRGVVLMNFPCPLYNIKGSWTSGLVTGRIMELLVRAYKLSGNKLFLDSAGKFLHIFYEDIEDMGCRIIINNDEWWYEEYASSEIDPPFVLNGMISAVLCINEYFEISRDHRASILVEKGINALTARLSDYDKNSYSYYDCTGKIASPFYHEYHVELLSRLMRKLPREIFEKYRNKWAEGNSKTFVIRSIKNLSKRSIGVFLLSFISYFLLGQVVYWLVYIFIK